MLTLDQWKDTRRVDHVSVGPLSIRHRGAAGGPTNLKVYDADVAAYPQATNDWDRVAILGRIIQDTLVYLSATTGGAVPQRYRDAVTTLRNAARQDMDAICGAANAPGRNVDLLARGQNVALTPKTISINIVYLAPIGAAPVVAPIDAIINNHIIQANASPAFQRAALTVARANANATVASQTATGQSILLPAGGGVPLPLQGKFADGGIGGPRMVTYSNALVVAPNSIDVVYMDHYDQADVQGRTFRAGADYGGATPNRPIVTVTLNPPAGGAATYPTTLVHELGHALTGCPDHSADPNNLMAGGANRNANNQLDDGQIAWMRRNAWTS